LIIVLTHAHLDHTGWLPCLTRDGYKNKIYANQATIELTTLSLKDSGHLQEEDAERARRKRRTATRRIFRRCTRAKTWSRC